MSIKVTIDWSTTGHEIEGFGVFAGRAEKFFIDKNRDEILDKLFSKEYLNLNIIRAEIMHSFSVQEGDINFHLDADIDVTPDSPDYPQLGSNDLKERGQLWILKKALQRYDQINKIVASTWSPPTYMKTQDKEQGNFYNRLDSTYREKFVEYLCEFAQQFDKAGIPIHAISPMNEPEYITAPWAGCFWWPHDIASLAFELKKQLQQKNINTKVMIGETANWSTADLWLSITLTLIAIKTLFSSSENPVDILASHGYTSILSPGKIETSPLPWLLTHSNMPKWITEVSSTTAFDPGIKTGLDLAESIHNFVFTRGVSAYIYWLGVVPDSNESLISSDGSSYSLNKTFDVFGNYSRYIRPGYRTLALSSDNPHNDIYISAFKSSDNQHFTSVAINKGKVPKELTLNINHPLAEIIPYLTNDEKETRWQKGQALSQNPSGEYKVLLPPESVITLTTITD